MADFWDGMTAPFHAYMNCTCAGGTTCDRTGGKFRWSNTYDSQWTGPNFDQSGNRVGIESNKTYILEMRYREDSAVVTRFDCNWRYPTSWNTTPITVTELESFIHPDTGELEWRDCADISACIVSTNGVVISNNQSHEVQSSYNYNDGTRDWAWRKFKLEVGNLSNDADLRFSLGYGEPCSCGAADGELVGYIWRGNNGSCRGPGSIASQTGDCNNMIGMTGGSGYSATQCCAHPSRGFGGNHSDYIANVCWGGNGAYVGYACMDITSGSGYSDCSCSGGNGCNNGGGGNSCDPNFTQQVSHGLQAMWMDRLSVTDIESIGGDDAFSRSNFGYKHYDQSGGVTLDASYQNFAVGRRGLKYNTAGDPINNGGLGSNGTGFSDGLRYVLMEMEGFGAPLPPDKNGNPVQGVLALKPRNELLYRDPTHADTSADTSGCGVNDDPMIVDAPTLIYDSDNYLRGFAIMMHFWNYDIAHRWRVQWKLYLPVDYIIDNGLQDRHLNETKFGMQLSNTSGVVFDSRLEGLDPVKGDKAMNSYDCCSSGNCTSGTEGNLYEFDHAIGHCNGNGGYADGSFRNDYDSHAFYISNSVSANSIVKVGIWTDYEEYLMQGVGTPESMWRLSSECEYGSAMWGCAFLYANNGAYQGIPPAGSGCGGGGFDPCSYYIAQGSLNAREMCELNMWGAGAPMQAPHAYAADSNANRYYVMANTLFVMEGFVEEHMHAAVPQKEDSYALDEGLERYEQSIIGNAWEMQKYSSITSFSNQMNRWFYLYMNDIDGGYSTSPLSVNYSHNPDALDNDGVGCPAGVSLGGMKGKEFDSQLHEATWGYNYKATTRNEFWDANVTNPLADGTGVVGYACTGADCIGGEANLVCSGVVHNSTATMCLTNNAATYGGEAEAWDELCCNQSCSQSCTPQNWPYDESFTYNIWMKTHQKDPPRYWLINMSEDRGNAVPYEARALCQRSDRSWEWCWVGRANYNGNNQSPPPS